MICIYWDDAGPGAEKESHYSHSPPSGTVKLNRPWKTKHVRVVANLNRGLQTRLHYSYLKSKVQYMWIFMVYTLESYNQYETWLSVKNRSPPWIQPKKMQK